jgi:D-3-phosphoglycerate dehydrogenase / 2-oxoglutarate reductase
MPKHRILIAESHDFSDQAIGRLREAGELILRDFKDRSQLLAEIKDIDVLWVRLRHNIDQELITRAPRLRIIVTPTTGLNHIDLDEAEKRRITVLSLKGETDFLKTIRATAEHTLGLTLALLRRIPHASEHALTGLWNRDLFKGTEIYGKTVGIVGYGRLGRIVAGYFTALGATVLTSDPNISPDDVDEGINLVLLPKLLSHADIVSLHVNLAEPTRGFFSKTCFNRMKHGSFFINTSRGELIDESALIDVLERGHLAGAALDVITGEFNKVLQNHPILKYALHNDNLIITPHIGGCTRESTAKTEEFLTGILLDLLEIKDS